MARAAPEWVDENDAGEAAGGARLRPPHKRHGCELCVQICASPSALAVHMRTHTGESPFACDMCPRAFKQKVHLAQHRAAHTRTRPHVCTKCGRDFANKANLRFHERNARAHRGEAQKPRHKCTECGKRLATPSGLARHQRRWHPTPC